MSENLPLPSWATYMTDAPRVTRYTGAAGDAVRWYGEMTRCRYQIAMQDGTILSLNVAQAVALAEIILDDRDNRPRPAEPAVTL